MGQAVRRISRYLQCTALIIFCAVAAMGSEPLTNEIIIKMVQSGVPTETIIRTIQSAESFRFGTLPGDLMQLQQANVPEEVVRTLAARINWPGTPPLVIAHPVPAPAAATPPQKPVKVRAPKTRQPTPIVYPTAAATATASIGAPVAARPAAKSFHATVPKSRAHAPHDGTLRRWSLAPFRLLRRLWSH